MSVMWTENVGCRFGHTGKQAIAVRWEVDADDFGALICNHVEESGVLMSEAIVVLTPDHCRQQDVERRSLDAPLDLQALLDPFAMLIDRLANCAR